LSEANRRLEIENRYFGAAATFEQTLLDWTDPCAVASAAALVLNKALPATSVGVWHIRNSGIALDLATLAASESKPRAATLRPPDALERWLQAEPPTPGRALAPAPPVLQALLQTRIVFADDEVAHYMPFEAPLAGRGGIIVALPPHLHERLADEQDALRTVVAVIAAAFRRADEQTAAQRLSEDLAETNRRLQQTQTELLRSRSLAMIAEMAAGAGHELNGPLAVISGRAQMLARSSDDPETHRILKTISDKAHECSGIVTELMDFARPQPTQLEPINLATLIADARDNWLRDTGLPASAVRVEGAAGPGGPQPVIRGDVSQLHVVLRELLGNATDAIAEEGGLIVLAVHVRDDDTVELTVRDNGCGMSPNILQRAFDPFFSHRRAGRRRGLGLPRVFRIVEAHGGRIWLESRTGEGTTARVRWPRSR
jgi:signal transduction histidine kinase